MSTKPKTRKARRHARRKAEDGWAGEWHRRTNRTTGTTIVLLDREKGADWINEDAEERWFAVCHEHGTILEVATRRDCHLSGSHPEDWCEECRALAEEGRKYVEPIVVPLTAFQEEEVRHGLSVDEDEGEVWGKVVRHSKTNVELHVFDVDAAIYRITSSRDILWANAESEAGSEASKLHSGGRSLDGLARKLIDAAGGEENLSSETRRFVEF